MRSFFNFLTEIALRFRVITLIVVTAIMIMGGVAATELQQELLPPIEFPQSFVLIQVSGMTSDEVLNVVTLRVEDIVSEVPGVVNVETQTSSTLGVFLLISTEFGVPQDEIRADIQAALDSVYFPRRAISAVDGEDPQEFTDRLIADMTPDVMLYIAQDNPSFLFQISPDVWDDFSDETLETLLAYLASQDDTPSGEVSALELLVEAEMVPQLEALDLIASVSIEGGQALPGEDAAGLQTVDMSAEDAESLLLQLSSDVWNVVAQRLDLGELNAETAQELAATDVVIPEAPPALPESWQFDHFYDATDLLEMASFTRSIAAVFNEFETSGKIVGALGTTEDLTPEAVQTMVDIQPSLANYFDGEQLAAMSPDVLEILQEYVELDGLSRDALAASILARDITGELELPAPEVLPNPWRLSPPQIITFSLSDLPLATFSVFSDAPIVIEPTDTPNDETVSTDTETPTEEAFDPAAAFVIGTNPDYADAPEGPALPGLYGFFGDQFGYELDTADDLLKIQFPADLAPLLGGTDGAAFLNLLPQLSQFGDALLGGGGDAEGGAPAVDPAAFATLTPALLECGVGIQDLLGADGFSLDPLANALITCPDVAVFEYLAENDPSFGSRLSPAVYALLPAEVYAVDGFAPLLGDAWAGLSQRPELADQPLANADALITLGDGSAASVLNAINAEVTGQFVGYEVRLFDSLSPEVIAYLVDAEPDFFDTLDSDVLVKFSPAVLASLSNDVLDNLDADVAEQVTAIATGEADSAAAQIAGDYASDIEPARPDAPVLNAEWQQIAGFYGVDLTNAYDLIRFEGALGGPPAVFINNLFLSPNGSNFAPDLLGNMSLDTFTYIAQEDATFIDTLTPRALNLFSEEVFNQLPQETQERAVAGEVFVPSTQVTRTNGAPSLLVTIFKLGEANTVTAFADVEAIINEIDANNDNIAVEVAFEQATFIEESISGVVLSGVLGAFFAIVNILVFLSGDFWGRSGRNITGIIVTIISVALLIGFYFIQGQDVNAMLSGEPGLISSLMIFGVLAGILILFYPSRLPYPAWRATIVIAVSIPLSILSALALMRWLPGLANGLLGNYTDIAAVNFLLRLAPEGLTLNIMTLSGLTVAVGRLVDDSIVVLENIFRQLQSGEMDKREAILYATRDVSVAIFSATSIAVLVFLPLGLTGGLISEFFLPFGIAVTYTLLSSFIVSITVVPVLAYFLISAENVPANEESWMERTYVPILQWALGNWVKPVVILVLAFASVGVSGYLLSQRPAAFLPEFGEPQISVSIAMAEGIGIIDTNDRAAEVEAIIRDIIPAEELTTLRTIVGGGGLDFAALLGGGGVTENIADITIGLATSENFELYALEIEEAVADIPQSEDESVTVVTGSATGGGFGGFELVVSGAPLADLSPEELSALDLEVLAALNALPELENGSSNLPSAEEAGDNAPITYIRVCDESCSPAIIYTGELNTEDTINFTTAAIEAIETNVALPDGVSVGQGFDSELQSEGFSSIFVAISIASVMIVIILIVVFRSPLYWIAVFLSVIVAPIGAAIALTLTDRVLGISSLIGLLMLLGLVVTNAIVLIDRVSSNREERGMSLYDALVEAGRRRLRPILMTALTTIIGLIPLALGVSEGSIIAAELGTVVIGGIISSTLLMLVVVPSAYYLLAQLNDRILGLFGVDTPSATEPSPEKEKSS